MVIVMAKQATENQMRRVIQRVEATGLKTCLSRGSARTIIGIIGDRRQIAALPVEVLDGVEKVVPVTDSYKLASRQFRPDSSTVDVGGVTIGGGSLVVMAGPCAVESREQLLEAAAIVRDGGAQFLRGGAFKPRTSPYSFQGLERQARATIQTVADLGAKLTEELKTKSQEAERVLGWKAHTPLRDGLASTFDWMKSARR